MMRHTIKNIQRQARELLLKIFYSYDQRGEDLNCIFNDYIGLKNLNPQVIKYTQKVISFFKNHKEKVDQLIKSHLQKWKFERIGYIERAMLRIAISELLLLKEETGKEKDFMIKRIVLDTLDLIECYTSSKKSVKFVNGILGRITRELFKDYKV
jgi:N utilization substance protein B